MEETKTTVEQNQEPEELNDASKAIVDSINEVTAAVTRSIYQSINYEALFNIMNQMDKYQEFKRYVDDFEKRAIEANENKAELNEAPKMWYDFLDITTVTTDSVGAIFDQLVTMAVEVSLTSAQAINSTVYDVLLVPQLQNVQKFCEQVSAVVGSVTRRMDDMEKELGVVHNVAATGMSNASGALNKINGATDEESETSDDLEVSETNEE